jgi:hypothetical protein
MAIDDDVKEDLAGFHPLLAVKIQKDREEIERTGKKYCLMYEKTYASGNTDSYRSSVKADNDEEAVVYAQDKLWLKDMMASWSTDITDAYLINPEGEKIMVPPFSKACREVG